MRTSDRLDNNLAILLNEVLARCVRSADLGDLDGFSYTRPLTILSWFLNRHLLHEHLGANILIASKAEQVCLDLLLYFHMLRFFVNQ